MVESGPMTQTIQFSKMHGLGNDFVVIDAINQAINLSTDNIRSIADRHFGVGCDQLLLVEASQTDGVDFKYRIFNANGGEVEQCGNGVRCFARFVYDKGLTDKTNIAVETNTGIVYPQIQAGDQVSVNMGLPNFDPASLPFSARQSEHYSLQAAGQTVDIGAVSMGNPHAVTIVSDINTAGIVETLGPIISHHPDFPREVNAGFMQIIDPGQINLRVFERGAGETLACGTGACAAVVVGRLWQRLEKEVQVNLPGGQLLIRWESLDEPVWMTGPATQVFEGTVQI